MSIITIRDTYPIKKKNLAILASHIKDSRNKEFMDYLEQLNADNIDLNMTDDHSNRLITYAIMSNNKYIVQELLDRNVNITFSDADGFGILYYPIKLGMINIIDILLQKDRDLIGLSIKDIKDAKGETPLMYCIQYNNIHALTKLLKAGVNINHYNKKGITALHAACIKGSEEILKIILKYSSNINIQTRKGDTCLHIACVYKKPKIVNILLNAGCDPNIPEYEHHLYPVFYSVVNNDISSVKQIINHHIDPNKQDHMGNTIIHYAIIHQSYEILNLLLEKIPIRSSIQNSFDENINTERESTYIDPLIVNIDGLTILHLMLYQYSDHFNSHIKKILPHSNLNYQDNNGNTIMHLLVLKNAWMDLREELCHKNINLFIRNVEGKNILDLLNKSDQSDILQITSEGYYNYLRRKPVAWKSVWQNKCSDETTDKSQCMDLIKKEIMQKHQSIPERKNKVNINLITDGKIEFTTFTGSLLDVVAGCRYLEIKYPFARSLFDSVPVADDELNIYIKSMGFNMDLEKNLPAVEIKWIFQQLFCPLKFNQIISNIIDSQPNTRFIIMPIGIILSNGNHSGILIYDRLKNELERFEPHGSDYPFNYNYNPNELDHAINERLSKLIPTNFKYVYPKDFLPKVGFQIFENNEISFNKNIGDPNGFCTLWCIWYVDHRLKYPDVPREKLIFKLMQKIRSNSISFRNTIRNYSYGITSYRDSILSKIGKNINDYLNRRLTDGEMLALTKYFNEDRK